MLAIQKRPICVGRNKYFSKVITMPNGIQAMVVFELIEKNGHVVAKAIYAEAIDINSVPEQNVCCLPGIASPVEFVPLLSTFNFIDFIKLTSDFSFVTSQPTRAPSF